MILFICHSSEGLATKIEIRSVVTMGQGQEKEFVCRRARGIFFWVMEMLYYLIYMRLSKLLKLYPKY